MLLPSEDVRRKKKWAGGRKKQRRFCGAQLCFSSVALSAPSLDPGSPTRPQAEDGGGEGVLVKGSRSPSRRPTARRRVCGAKQSPFLKKERKKGARGRVTTRELTHRDDFLRDASVHGACTFCCLRAISNQGFSRRAKAPSGVSSYSCRVEEQSDEGRRGSCTYIPPDNHILG